MHLSVARSRELHQAIESITANKSLYLLEIPPTFKVLFRVDGLVVQLSPIAFALLQASPQVLDARLDHSASEHGACTTEDAIVEIAGSPIVQHEPPPLGRPDPQKAQPSGILIMVTQTCNLACAYCYAGGGTYGGSTKLMPEAEALAAIDLMLRRAPEQKSFTVTLFGGEPLLNFPLVQRIVAYCERIREERAVDFRFSMTTNGTVVTDEIVDFLKAHRFTLMVSFAGPGQDRSRPFAGGDGSDSVVRRNLHRLAASGVPFQLRATVTRELAHRETVDDLVQIGRSLGNKRVMTSSVSTTKNSVFPANEELTLGPDEVARLKEIYRDVSEEHLAAAKNGKTEKVVFDPSLHLVRALAEGKAAGLGRCGAGLGMAAASTDGKIYPCHRFVGMKDYVIGTIASGVDAEKVQAFFATADAANNAKCEVCFARQICGGFCFYNIADGAGGFQPPDERECDGFRDSVKHAISILLRLQDLPPEQARRYFENARV